MIISKIKECLPSQVLKYKTSKGLEVPANNCDVKEFADFLLNTLGEMVAPVKEEAFYKPQRLDHNGKPIKQESKVAKVDVKKVKPVMYVVSKRPKSHTGVKRVQNPKTYTKVVKK